MNRILFFCARFHKRDLVKHFFKTILVVSAVVECHGKGDNVVMGLLLADTCSCAGVGL